MQGGVIESGSKEFLIKWVAAQHQRVLSNKSKCLLPRLEMKSDGNGILTPGASIKCLVHSYNTDSDLDESVPTLMIASRMAYYEDCYSYTSKAELATVYTGY